MIQKTTKMICDNCGQSIYDYEDILVSKCLKHLKENNLVKLFTKKYQLSESELDIRPRHKMV